jgi:uncharacterized protein involved in type VI secretion and phage assembly
MSTLVPALQAVVRDELAAVHTIELGIVTATYTNEGGTGDTNLAVDARLRGSALELQHIPVAIGRLGLSLSPRLGDLAVLAFVGGDLNAAVAIGFLYDEQTRPPDASATDVVYVVPDDPADDDRRLEMQLPNGNKLTIQDGKVTIAMGQTTLDAAGDITLSAQGDLSLSAQGKASIEAQADASLKGMSVSVEGQMQAELKGVTTTISGITSFSSS